MGIKRIALIIPLITILTIIGCSMGSDTATVMINTGLQRQAVLEKTPLLDRIIAFLTFSSNAQANPPSDSSIDMIKMRITGPGMSAMENIDIPLTTGQTTVEVPAGSSRTFTIIAYDDIGDGIIYSVYGGISSVDLTPGDSVKLDISMGQLPLIDSMYWLSSVLRTSNQQLIPFNFIDWSTEGTVPISGFNLYRAQGGSRVLNPSYEPSDESYIKIATIPGISIIFYEDYSIDADYVYWYKLGAYNEYGEGDLTDPLSDWNA